jgi:hypothetical protein
MGLYFFSFFYALENGYDDSKLIQQVIDLPEKLIHWLFSLQDSRTKRYRCVNFIDCRKMNNWPSRPWNVIHENPQNYKIISTKTVRKVRTLNFGRHIKNKTLFQLNNFCDWKIKYTRARVIKIYGIFLTVAIFFLFSLTMF